MGSNIIELAKLGHERAAELKASCGAVDVRSLVQLISDLATQLEVQFVRSTNMAVQLANAESKCRELAAENAALKGQEPKAWYIRISDEVTTDPTEAWMWRGVPLVRNDVEPPGADAFLAEVRAQESAPLVRALTVIANSEQHDGETVVCDFDTLISVAAGALRDHYADQLRKGVQS